MTFENENRVLITYEDKLAWAIEMRLRGLHEDIAIVDGTQLGLSALEARTLLHAADESIQAHYADAERMLDLPSRRAIHRERLQDLYSRAVAAGKFGVARGVLRDMAEEDGLYDLPADIISEIARAVGPRPVAVEAQRLWLTHLSSAVVELALTGRVPMAMALDMLAVANRAGANTDNSVLVARLAEYETHLQKLSALGQRRASTNGVLAISPRKS